MTLYDRAVDLAVKLEAAAASDASSQVLARGQVLVTQLDAASSCFTRATTFAVEANLSGRPGIDHRAIARAVGAFRGGLTKHGPQAFQHQPAANLIEVARQQVSVVERWARAAWQAQVDERAPQAEPAQQVNLHGSPSYRTVAQARLSKLRLVRDINPLTNGADLESHLGGQSVAEWLAAVEGLAAELQKALDNLAAEKAAHSPAVQAALARAASPGGLPLEDFDATLLEELREAGVADQLTVRRA